MSFDKEFRDDLPTLLNGQENNDELSTKLNVSGKSSLSVFDTPDNSDVSVAVCCYSPIEVLTILHFVGRLYERKIESIEENQICQSVRSIFGHFTDCRATALGGFEEATGSE